MQISEQGLALTKSFEGLRLTAYRDCAGILTIGYGHTGTDVHEGQVITLEQAEALLKSDMQTAIACVNRSVKVPLTQNQFDALVDFAFNVGTHSLESSTLLAKLNAEDYLSASGEFLKWDHAGGQIVAGLLKRREAEQTLFNTSLSATTSTETPQGQH